MPLVPWPTTSPAIVTEVSKATFVPLAIVTVSPGNVCPGYAVQPVPTAVQMAAVQLPELFDVNAQAAA